MSKRSNRVAVAVIVASGVAGSAAGQCIEGDINGDGIVNGIDLAFVLQNWNQTCPAVIEAVTPSVGLPAGGTPITITGQQLGGVLSVTIGGVPATNVVGVNPTTITALTPPSKSLGATDVVVTTTSGTAVLAGGFDYTFDILDWATTIEFEPDPAVITSAEWRERIIATGLPWRVQDNASGIEMLLIPSGTFMMGCSPSDLYGCYSSENPVHEVTLTKAIYIGRYEVTQAQWTAVMGANPSYFQSASAEVPAEQVPNRPVEKVSWNEIQNFEAVTGLRLPTEAEWEYACRAGTPTAFNLPPNGTNADSQLGLLGWYSENSLGQPHPVGQNQANNLGLHDMHGNVWEWAEDWYDPNYYSWGPPVDPPGPTSGSGRVLRGGGWDYDSDYCRAATRVALAPADRFYVVGFRVARTP